MTVEFEKLKKINRVLECDGGHDGTLNILEKEQGEGSSSTGEMSEIDRLNTEHLNIILDFLDRAIDGELSEEEFLDSIEKMHANLTRNDHLFDAHAMRHADELEEVIEKWREQSGRMHAAYDEFALFVEDEDLDHFRNGYKEIKAALEDRKPLYAKFDEAMEKGKQAAAAQQNPSTKPEQQAGEDVEDEDDDDDEEYEAMTEDEAIDDDDEAMYDEDAEYDEDEEDDE